DLHLGPRRRWRHPHDPAQPRRALRLLPRRRPADGRRHAPRQPPGPPQAQGPPRGARPTDRLGFHETRVGGAPMVTRLDATTPRHDKALGGLLGGIIGDAMGTPCQNKTHQWIAENLGWVDDFTSDGTDDTVMKDLLARALIRTDGHATLDDWAAVMLEDWD